MTIFPHASWSAVSCGAFAVLVIVCVIGLICDACSDWPPMATRKWRRRQYAQVTGANWFRDITSKYYRAGKL